MPPSFQNSCAVIVTYNPDAHFPERLEKVLTQFPFTVVVDNASSDSSTEMLCVLQRLSTVMLLANASNLGVAAALNQGLRLAAERGFEWALTLDQDTEVHDDIRETLSAIYLTSGIGDVIVGGNYWNVHSQKNFVECNAQQNYIERKTLITSGTLLSVALVKHIGGFREDYFIDSVDHEFCLRARAHGCKILMCCKPVMRHSIGAEKIGWLHSFSSFNHSPLRKYFIARNAVVTARLYFFQEPVWALRQACRLLFDFMSILLIEQGKWKKTQAFLVGLVHGISGKMGSIEKTWPNGAG